MAIIKVASSMFKKRKLFSLTLVKITGLKLSTFADFWPLKSRSQDWAPPNLMRIQSLFAPKLCSNFNVSRSANL